MTSTAITIPIVYVHSMLQGVVSRGRPVDCFLEDAGIAPELLKFNHSRVTVDQYVELFKSLVTRLDDDLLGLQSRPLRRGSFALMARSAVGAPTLEVAVRRIARTYRLLQDDALFEIELDGALAGFTVRFIDPSAVWPNFLSELILRVFWQLLRWLAGGRLPVARFDFAFAMPEYAESYGQVFPGTLNFNCRRSGFWFDASYLKARVRQDEESLFRYLSNAQSNILMPHRNPATMIARLRSHLQQTIPRWPDMHETAQAFHLSTATLQRRLASEGTSFQVLKDGLRRDLAIIRLNSGSVHMSALARELGFSDVASFQRAFKGWTGSPPGTYRRGSERTATGAEEE